MQEDAPRAGLETRRARAEAEIATLRARFVAAPQRYAYILMVVSLVDGSDRQLLSTVFEDVKRAFDISDAQLGLLTAAYSLVATLSIIPFGFLTDRTNRVRLIALGFVPWSIAQIWSGVAGSFAMLFVARLFLGTIEATNGPSTPSLIGDYYPVERRSRVFGILGMGGILGATFGLAAGGLAASIFGWRTAFVLWGLMGFLAGGAVLRLLREPERGVADALYRAEERLRLLDAAAETEVEEPAEEVAVDGFDYRSLTPKRAIREVVRVRTLWVVLAATSVTMFFNAATIWVPTFYRRYHGMSAGTAGATVAVVSLATVAAIVVGSRLGDRHVRRRRPERRFLLIGVAQITAMVGYLTSFSVESTPLSVLLLMWGAFLSGIPIAVVQAMMLDVVVPHLRGRASAVQAAVRVVGTAGAPLTFGILSDALGLRSAWLTLIPLLGLAGLLMLIGLRTYPKDAERALSEAGRQMRLELRDELG